MKILKKWKNFFFFLSSQVELKEMSFQLLLENWQGSSIPDGGGEIIPPARNGERECSGEWVFCHLFDPACFLTMPINKSLHMDPHASLLVGPVTEYSAPQGSSSFSNEHQPCMDAAILLLTLKQGKVALWNIWHWLMAQNYQTAC